MLVSSHLRAQTAQSLPLPLISPSSIAFDASGNLYLAESGRHVIDRLDASGKLTVVAGDGIQGFAGDGGQATAAELDSPQAIALDSAGNLYISDTHNHRVRRVAATSGIISTIAGNGSSGYSGDGATAATARLSLPTALALDQAGNLYIADSGNQRIRKLSFAAGIITTIAGNGTQGSTGDLGPALAASLDTPSGLAVDTAGDLYLADLHNPHVRRVAHDTGIITSMNAQSALRLPRGLSLDPQGNVLVAQAGSHQIVRIAPNGTLSVVAGTGTEGFAGDNAAASAALLDRPRATGISPAGLITLADTGNRRIRQIDTAGIIHTLPSAASGSESLSLNAPSSVSYGSGVLTATLSSALPASGSVTFAEVVNGTSTVLGTGSLAANAATLSAASLPAGSHTITASYAGDVSHASAASNALILSISRAPVNAAPVPASIFYGQAIPPLSGSMTGVLARDVSLVSASFTTTAMPLSPAGSYPIAASLSGPAARNYVVTVLPASLMIQQAPTVTTAASSQAAVAVGSALTITARAIPQTQGVPTGRITFFDTGTALGSIAADATGTAPFSTSSLGVGTHAITAVYGGDGNFLPSTSQIVTEVVSAAGATLPDFTILVSGASSQTAPAGSISTFGFTVQFPHGSLDSPILLTASGMPPGGTSTLNPPTIPPGGAVTHFTLSVQTRKSAAATAAADPGLSLGGMLWLLALSMGRRRRVCARLLVGLCTVSVGAVLGCGTVGSQLPAAASSSASYPITITAASTLADGSTLLRTALVTLVVQ